MLRAHPLRGIRLSPARLRPPLPNYRLEPRQDKKKNLKILRYDYIFPQPIPKSISKNTIYDEFIKFESFQDQFVY